MKSQQLPGKTNTGWQYIAMALKGKLAAPGRIRRRCAKEQLLGFCRAIIATLMIVMVCGAAGQGGVSAVGRWQGTGATDLFTVASGELAGRAFG